MLQTEFNDKSGSKLVLCWDASIDTNETAVETIRESNDLVERINHLYGTISASSAEFVQCMRQLHCSKQDEQVPGETSNLSFKISVTSTERPSEEISRLRSEIDKLQRENLQLETNLKCKITDISNLEKAHEQDKRQLRNKYQKDMSELRVYFEKICHDNYERDITSNIYNQKKNKLQSNSNSDDGATDLDYGGKNCISFDDVDYNCTNKSKESISSDLKMFIVKAYEAQVQKFRDDFNCRKEEEMERLKEDNVKYLKMIETLQNEMNRLVSEIAVEDNTREIHRDVREEYEAELEELQDVSDNEFLRKMNNDKVTLEKEFKWKFENALNELNNEWEKKIEVLSELLVRSTIKSVNLEESNTKISQEKETLQMKLIECFKVFFHEKNVPNAGDIVEELLKMKKIHEYEIDTLQKENISLHNKIEDLQQRIPPANSSREKVITMLIEEITDLIMKEQLGENVTWPTELATLENLFSKKLHSTRNLESNKQGLSFPQFENDGAIERLDTSLDLNQLFEERDGLRKVNIALKGVINMFTRYLTNCEEECNNTIIGALINAEKVKKNLDTTGFEVSASDIDLTTTTSIDHKTKSVRFSPNISEFMSLLNETDHVDASSDRNISVTGNDLKSWLQIVRNEAAIVLQLISNQKNDVNCEKRSKRSECAQTASIEITHCDEGTQTTLLGQEIEKKDEKLTVLQQSLQEAENKLSELQEKTSYLEGFIKPTESLKGYGKADHSIQYPKYVPNMMGAREDEELESDLDVTNDSEDYCAKCDDLQKQIRYVQNLLEQNKKHLERQALERDFEREEYDKQIQSMVEERDVHISTREKFKGEASLFEQQVKELNGKLEENMECKKNLETKIRSAEKQLQILRKENVELKEAAAIRNEQATQVERKLKIKEEELRTLQMEYQKLVQELDSLDEIREKQVQEFSDVHVSSSNVCDKMKEELMEIERVVTCRTRMLENTAVVVVASSVLSSPSASISEDISCEQNVRLFSPNESDLSSSPGGRNRVSFDILSCLHDKLRKLFRAEDASFKKIRDQEMQLAKINDEIKNLELERDMLNESLRTTSDKLSQTKREVENWRLGEHSTPYQSTVQLELTAKIRKLQSEIKHYKEYLTQKDDCDATFLRCVNSLLAIISSSSSQFDKKDEMEENLRQLLARFENLEHEKRIRQQQFAILVDDTDENDGTPKRKMRRLDRCEAFAAADGKNGLRRSRVSFAENLESYSPDPDVTRRAPAAVVSPVPRLTSGAGVHDSFSNKISLLNLSTSGNPSFFNALPPNIRPDFDVERIPIPEKKDLENNDSISLDSDAAAFGSSTECDVEKSGIDGQDSSLIVGESSPNKRQVRALRDSIEREKKRHRGAYTMLRHLKKANALRGEDGLRDIMACSGKTEAELGCMKLDLSKEPFLRDESADDGVLALTRELKTSITMMEELEQKLQDVERKLNDEVSVYKSECRESKNVCQAVIKERIDVEKRYEQLSKNAAEFQEQLHAEKSKSVELSAALENVRNEIANLQKALESEKKLVQTLTQTNSVMEKELERANWAATEEKVSNLKMTSGLRKRPESLRDLAEKVQKEVELAAELDEHLFKNLKSTSTSSALLNNLSQVSSTLSPDLERVLFKILQDGCENLMSEDKEVLMEFFDLPNARNTRQLEERNKELIARVESEGQIIADLRKEQSFLRSEVDRLERVLAYYEERVTFLTTLDLQSLGFELKSKKIGNSVVQYVRTTRLYELADMKLTEEAVKMSKLHDYRERYVKNEIELTAVRCTRTQLECQVRGLKKDCNELKSQLESNIQKCENEEKSIMKENIDLKHKVNILKNQMEALTAEMNSIKVISQYHSNSEAELSRSLHPLKTKLEEVQKECSRVNFELETAVGKLQKLGLDLKVERMHNRQLEEYQRSILQAKREIEENLIELKMKYDDLIWEKQKVEDKLNALELAETRKRRLRLDKINLSREENEFIQRQLEDEYDRLRQNVFKMRDSFTSLHFSWKEVCEKCQTWFHRMLKAESNQRALVYQKNYFITRGYYESTLIHPTKRKFRSVALAVMSVRRMEFLTRRRFVHGQQTMLKCLTDGSPNVKFYPWFDFIIDLPMEINTNGITSESERNNEDVKFLPIDDSLKALQAQFQILLKKWD